MTSNPMIHQGVVENVILDSKPMTASGAINKTFILLGVVILSGWYTWSLCAGGFHDKVMLLAWIGIIAGLILAIITRFKPNTSHITAPAYAICEGLAIGAISYMYDKMYDGIVLSAVGITLLAMFSMLFLYKARVIQATPTFKKVIITSTLGVAVFYLIMLVASLFGYHATIFNGSLMGIGLSFLICAIAAFNFILDFDFIEQGEKNNLPDYFEWYGGFALLVTIIWLYLEVLKLLAQLSRRR